jgi:branched-chain amino acid transport system substrate-binding protein
MLHRCIGRAARALALVAAGALLATLHGTAANAQAQVFRVGVVTALSGDNAQGGASTKRDYDLWANAVNAAGGIQTGGGKYKVELAYFDD